MKRHPTLRELSSDHHHGLVWAKRLATASDIESDSARQQARETATAFLDFWEQHTVPHFREEEEVLLPAFARYGDPASAPIVQMLVEHVHIRRLVDDLRAQLQEERLSSQTMREAGESLRAHIRHEENVVFPIIEAAMPEEAMAALARKLIN